MLGYQPVVSLLPEPEAPSLLASVRLGAREPVTDRERGMIDALPHRHTHRGGFSPGPLPRGLLIGLQHDAVVEHAALALIDQPVAYTHLAAIVANAASNLSTAERSRADVRQWVRLPGSTARDGIPAAPSPRRPVRSRAGWSSATLTWAAASASCPWTDLPRPRPRSC